MASSRIGPHGVRSSNYPNRGSFPTNDRAPRGEKGRRAGAVNQAADLWTKCTGSLREQVSDSTWQLWLSGIEPVEYADGVFVLEVPNGLIRERVESRYLPMIEDTLANEVGSPVRGRLQVHERAAAAAGGARRGRRRSSSPGSGRCSACPPTPTRCTPRRGRGRGAGEGQDGPRRGGRPTRPEVHLRDLRGRVVEPPGPRGGPGRGRNPWSFVQSALHLRGVGPGQDPPPPRHRQLRDRELLAAQGALRHDRDVHERLRRLPADLDHADLQAPLPRLRRPPHRRRAVHGAQRRAPGGVLPHLQRPQGRVEADRAHLGPAAQVDRDARGPAAQPLPVGPDHRDRPTRPRDHGWRSCAPSASACSRTSPTTSSSSSPRT